MLDLIFCNGFLLKIVLHVQVCMTLLSSYAENDQTLQFGLSEFDLRVGYVRVGKEGKNL